MGLRKPLTHDGLRPVVERDPGREVVGLLGQLREGTASERRWAARDLASHPEAAAALGNQLLAERESEVQEAIFTSLGAIGTAEAVNVLLPLLRSDVPMLRNGAIEALIEMPEAVAPRITALLQDADPDVRIFSVNLLGDLKHPDIGRWLEVVLEREPQVNVVAAALEVLAEVGTPAIVPALQRAVLRFPEDPFLQFAADVAIERIESV